jgi:hypothetical protein
MDIPNQKVFYLSTLSDGQPTEYSQNELDKLISEGWKIVSTSAQHCACSSASETYSSSTQMYGGFLIILNKPTGSFKTD